MAIVVVEKYYSFTYNLYDYLLQAGAECIVVRNDVLSLQEFERLDIEAIVLSPGPKRPSDAGIMLPLIAAWYKRVPMLGICLGHQALGEFFGARLIKARVPVHGKTTPIQHNGHSLFRGAPLPFSVMRYHSLVLESLEHTPLDSIAQTVEGEIMALAHRSLPLTGVQFHPESIGTEFGLQMLKNWLDLIKKRI